jgi:hypothetical protein
MLKRFYALKNKTVVSVDDLDIPWYIDEAMV